MLLSADFDQIIVPWISWYNENNLCLKQPADIELIPL